ncbi:YveK family protein [Gallicola sp. Sow4_E12]|uniref:YveK family protein n=1 Tax=Gallicola sp. Sow4_E12 TaxID=3438785 RepID=UPI003F93893C
MRKFSILDIIKLFFMAALGGVLFYGAVYFFVRPVYSSNTILRITNAEESGSGNSERRRLNTYNEALNSSKVRDQVLGNLEIDFTPSEYRQKVKVGRIGDSNLFGIKIKDTIAQRSMDLANESAEVFQKEIGSFIEGEQIDIVDEAEMPGQADTWLRRTAAVIGVLAGLLIGVMKKMKKVKNDDSFTSVESLKKRFDFPVLGEIPQLNKENQKTYEVSELFKEETNENEAE